MTGQPDVRFAVVGTNWITTALIAAGRTVPGFQLQAVCSRGLERAEAFAAEQGAATVHTSVADLAADDEVDAVYVASPNSLHAEQSAMLLAGGKHVLCEKPLAASAAQAAGVVAAASSAGRLLMEAYMTPLQPNFSAVRDALPELGAVRRSVFWKDQYSSRYDSFLFGQLPNAFNPQFAAGSLVDLGIYPVALAVHLFGPPERVTATGLLLPSGVDGQGTVLLGYPGHEVVAMHSKVASAFTSSRVEGEAGTLVVDECSVPTRVELIDRHGARRDHSRPQDPQHMRYEVQHFIELVGAGALESPVNSHARSLAVLKVLDEARRQVGVRFPTDG